MSWKLQEAKARLGEVIVKAQSEGPQHGQDDVALATHESLAREVEPRATSTTRTLVRASTPAA